nr:MAG: DNA pilot protein [Microvirus sp.]
MGAAEIAAIVAAAGAVVASAVGTGATAGMTEAITNKTINFQRQVNYQNYILAALQQQNLQSREDTAIQRRVSDLKAAGLSPVLAAGQGASSGTVAPVKFGTPDPRQDLSYIQRGADGVAQALQISMNAVDLEKKKQEYKIVKEYADKIKPTVQGKIANLNANAARSYTDAATKQHDLEAAQRSGLPVKTSMPGGMVKDALNIILHGTDRLKQDAILLEKIKQSKKGVK